MSLHLLFLGGAGDGTERAFGRRIIGRCGQFLLGRTDTGVLHYDTIHNVWEMK